MTITFQDITAAHDRLQQAIVSRTEAQWPLSVEVIEDPNMVDRKQVRFPRSKKQRIRAKWAKRPENWGYLPKPYAFRVGGRLICHPVIAQRLRERFKEAR